MKQDLVVVKCPVCGTEYLPSEIFMPDAFFGKQKEIVRNDTGKIEFYLGDDADYDEEFVCENCLTKLKIHANLSFDVSVDKENDDYVTIIDKPVKMKLEETDLFND